MYEGLEFRVVGNDQNWVVSFRCTIKRTPSWCDIIFGSFGSKLLPGCADFGVRLPVWQEICDMAISGFLRDRGASVLVDTSMLKPIETVKLPPTPKWYLLCELKVRWYKIYFCFCFGYQQSLAASLFVGHWHLISRCQWCCTWQFLWRFWMEPGLLCWIKVGPILQPCLWQWCSICCNIIL